MKKFVNVLNYMFDIEEEMSSYKFVELDNNEYYVVLKDSLMLNYSIMKEEIVNNNKYVLVKYYEFFDSEYSLVEENSYLLDDDEEVLEEC